METMTSLRWAFFLFTFLVLVGIGEYVNVHVDVVKTRVGTRNGFQRSQVDGLQASPDVPSLALPSILLEMGVYPNGSFVNEIGAIPVYWENHDKSFLAGNVSSTSQIGRYGPCYGYRREPNWEKQIAHYRETNKAWYNDEQRVRKNPTDLQGHCRPGFLIIGTWIRRGCVVLCK